MKTITIRADREFDALLTRLAQRLESTRSSVIRDAVRSYEREVEREALRRKVREASLRTRVQAEQAGEEFDAVSADGL